MDRFLYNQPIIEDAQIDTGSQLSRQLSQQGALGSGKANVESLSLDPGQQLLKGSFRDPSLGELYAKAVEELFDAGGIEAVPYHGIDGHDSVDGYYTLENVDVGPADASTGAVQTYDGMLTKKGTRKSHVRAVKTAPAAVDTVGASDYSPDDLPPATERVALPTDARRPRWFEPVSGAIEPANPLNKWQFPPADGESATFRYYDLADASFYDPGDSSPPPPTLLYDVPYGRERSIDVRVWDTAPKIVGPEKVVPGDLADGTRVGGPGATVGEAIVGESVREDTVAVASTWQPVFVSDHEFRGEVVIDNSILRLRFDDERGSLTAERSRGHFDDWSAQPLRPSSWALRDVDLTHIGLARVDAQVEFAHPDEGRYTLNCTLARGAKNALWTVAQNQSGAPAFGLAQKLAPVAEFGGVSVQVANERAGLVAREEIRR